MSLLTLSACTKFTPARAIPPLPATAAITDGGTDAALDHMPIETKLTAELSAVGLDVTNLPEIDALTKPQLQAVMKTFSSSLGVECNECHTAGNFDADTPNKRIAKNMWDVFARSMTLANGKALYCDSCHQGSSTFLDRSGPEGKDNPLGKWMHTAYVDGLAQRDLTKHDCSSCHGKPFNPGFLDDWGGTAVDMGGTSSDGGGAKDGGGAPTDMGVTPNDLSNPPVADMSQPAHDLSTPGISCSALVDCLNNCTTTACQNKCIAKGSSVANEDLNAAIDCGNNACIAAGRCTDANDNSSDCVTCFNNSLSGGATGDACTPTNDKQCGVCSSEWLTCANN